MDGEADGVDLGGAPGSITTATSGSLSGSPSTFLPTFFSVKAITTAFYHARSRR
jgi:hypothetical protein